MNRWEKAWIGLGSNLGDRPGHLQEALNRLQEREDVRVSRISSLYETDPVGMLDQPDFLNMAAEVETALSPRQLLVVLLSVERSLGRIRTVRWGPRTVDLDLLLFGNRIIREPELTVPHPRMTERAFVLIPLAEIAGDIGIPGTGRTVADFARSLAPAEDVRPSRHRVLLPQDKEGPTQIL